MGVPSAEVSILDIVMAGERVCCGIGYKAEKCHIGIMMERREGEQRKKGRCSIYLRLEDSRK